MPIAINRPPQQTSGTARTRPQIPSLGPNLGKLGFTDLKEQPEDVIMDLPQEKEAPVVAAPPKKGPPMGLGLNLASV